MVETFFRNSSFISNTKSQLALFTFSIAKRVMFRPCPEGMANSGPNMAIVETFFQLQFFSNTKSQLALFTFSIAKRVK